MTPFDIQLGTLCRNLAERKDLGVFETCIVFARYSVSEMLVKSRQSDGYITLGNVKDFEYFFNDTWSRLDDND